MALFAKKDKSDSAGVAPAAGGTKKGLSFGRGKGKAGATGEPDAAAAPAAGASGVEDFSDFAEDTAAAQPAPAPAAVAKAKKTKKAIKGGAVVGLNIGNESIKAVEVRGKGENVVVTAMGMVPTPPESISNGVVMSTSALGNAIRDLFKQSGIKTRRVISSVAGTGALVVRVIEVPRMSDNELRDNMAVDADRYIPFPPSEVVLDFQALRQLPTDPDNPNMEVLLAAAQREIVDLHVNVLDAAKLDPQYIDVEPLAAARSLFYDGLATNGAGSHEPDYHAVSAVINIGATTTEISVLRGDVLVFTRSIPRGGQALTEQLATELDLSLFDAERLKCEIGDALPPFGDVLDVTPTAASTPTAAMTIPPPVNSDFAGFDDAFGAEYADADASGGAAVAGDWADFDSLGSDAVAADSAAAAPEPTAAPTGILPGAEAAPLANSDPFDLDFFNQGPQQNEPQEQHQQRQDEGKSPFDFTDFTLDEARAHADNLPAQAPSGDFDDDLANIPALHDATVPPTTAPQTGASAGAADWQSAQQPDEVSPTGQMFHFNTVDDPALPVFPSLPVFPTLPAHLANAGIEGDDLDAIPSMVEEPAAEVEGAIAEPIVAAEVAAPPATPTIFNFGGETPAAVSPAEAAPTVADVGDAGAGSALMAAAGLGAEEAAQTELGAAPASPEVQAEFASIPAPAGEIAEPVAAAAAVASAYDFDNIETAPAVLPVADAALVSEPWANQPAAVDAATDEPLDIDSLLAGTPAAHDDFGADFGAVETPTAAGHDDFGDMSAFGAGLSGESTVGVSPERVHEIIAPLLDELAGEVRRSLEYFASRYPDSGVRHIALVGGGALLTNMDAYFTQTLGIPTTRGDVFGGVVLRTPQLPPGYAEHNAPVFAVALGLALRDVT